MLRFRSLALVLSSALAIGLTGCAGGGDRAPGPSRSFSAGTAAKGASSAGGHLGIKTDYDNDDPRPVDNDVLSVRSYGHAAARPEQLAIHALVRRYYRAAAAGDGAMACTAIAPSLARGAPASYGQYGPSYERGAKTCGEVLAALFKHLRRRLVTEARRLEITGVRVEGTNGFVLLRFGARAPERQIAIGRYGTEWWLQMLLDGEMRKVP